MAGAYVPHQVSETPDKPVEDCAPSADLMAVNKATLGAYPASRAEREAIRHATGKPHGGLTVVDLNRANGRLFGHGLAVYSISFARFLVDHMAKGDGAVLLGSANQLPDHYNRWDPAFGRKPNSGHAAYVQADGPAGRKHGHLWWMNPLAPWSYRGEWIAVDDVRAYAWSIGQSGIVAEGAWAEIAGGIATVAALEWAPTSARIGTFTFHGAGHRFIDLNGTAQGTATDGQTVDVFATGRLPAPFNPGPGDRQDVFLIRSPGAGTYFAIQADGIFSPTPAADCTAAVAQATAVLSDRIRKAQLDLAG